jgi:hypothetical protein
MKDNLTNVNKKKQFKAWLIRICALLLVLLLVAGSCYYTIWALLV